MSFPSDTQFFGETLTETKQNLQLLVHVSETTTQIFNGSWIL